jgi:hypothetical protein
MSDDRIGHLFPAGGPVPPDLVIGREGDIAELHRRVNEGIHTFLTGERRIGKTTVCNATCDRLREDGSIVIQVEVPESGNAKSLLQMILDRSLAQNSAVAQGRKLFKAATPLIEKVLSENGIPLDLSEFGSQPAPPQAAATILSLPLELASATGASVVFYLDELQRVVDYAEGEQVLGNFVDLYSGRDEVVLLVDGSSERALEGMMRPPIGFGKLVDRLPLAGEIAASSWREGLPDRFEQARLTLPGDALEELIRFGEGRPYATMSAARYSALNARKLGSTTVGEFEVKEGIAEARRHLEEDAR